MRLSSRFLIRIATGFIIIGWLHAQEPVIAASDTDALFRSSDPTLQANKMVVYGIFRDLLEAGHWAFANTLSHRALHSAQSECCVGMCGHRGILHAIAEGEGDAYFYQAKE